jgi:hypothetical protein
MYPILPTIYPSSMAINAYFGRRAPTSKNGNTDYSRLQDFKAAHIANELLQSINDTLKPNQPFAQPAPRAMRKIYTLLRQLIKTLIKDKKGLVHLYPYDELNHTIIEQGLTSQTTKGSSKNKQVGTYFSVGGHSIVEPEKRYKLGSTSLLIGLETYNIEGRLVHVVKLYSSTLSGDPFFSTSPIEREVHLTKRLKCFSPEEQDKLHQLAQSFSDYVSKYFDTDEEIKEMISQAP